MSAKPHPAVSEAEELDPVAAAIARAPIGAPMTEQERRAIEEARAEVAAGARSFSAGEITATIEDMRRRQEGE